MEVSADNRLSPAKFAADNQLSAAQHAADNQLHIFSNKSMLLYCDNYQVIMKSNNLLFYTLIANELLN